MVRNIAHARGTYALVLACDQSFHAPVGRLGEVTVDAGYWIYVGSAFGPGGLPSRLRHHLIPSRRPHWHLDYIKSDLRALDAWTTVDRVKREHLWADVLAGMHGASRPITGFGATDCTCPSHLIHLPRRPSWAFFRKAIRRRCPHHGPMVRVPLDTVHRW